MSVVIPPILLIPSKEVVTDRKEFTVKVVKPKPPPRLPLGMLIAREWGGLIADLAIITVSSLVLRKA